MNVRATVFGVAQRLQREAPLVLFVPYQKGIHAQEALIVSELPPDLADPRRGDKVATDLAENILALREKQTCGLRARFWHHHSALSGTT